MSDFAYYVFGQELAVAVHLALWYVLLVCHQYDVCENYVGSVYVGLSESIVVILIIRGVRHFKQSPWSRLLLNPGWHGISGTVDKYKFMFKYTTSTVIENRNNVYMMSVYSIGSSFTIRTGQVGLEQ